MQRAYCSETLSAMWHINIAAEAWHDSNQLALHVTIIGNECQCLYGTAACQARPGSTVLSAPELLHVQGTEVCVCCFGGHLQHCKPLPIQITCQRMPTGPDLAKVQAQVHCHRGRRRRYSHAKLTTCHLLHAGHINTSAGNFKWHSDSPLQ